MKFLRDMKVPGLNLDPVTAIATGIRPCFTDTYRVNCAVLWVSLADTKNGVCLCPELQHFILHIFNEQQNISRVCLTWTHFYIKHTTSQLFIAALNLLKVNNSSKYNTNKIQDAYKLSEDFAKPYFHRYWTEVHDVTNIWKRNICSFIVTLNAFDVRPTCETADFQAILPFPPKPFKHVLCDVPDCDIDALSQFW